MKELGPPHFGPKPEGTPRWVKTCRWIWHEDDARPHDRERIEEAWQRLFDEEAPSRYEKAIDGRYVYGPDNSLILSSRWRTFWAQTFDGGDAMYWLSYDGRIYSFSYEGGAIGLIVGPLDLIP